MRDARTRDVLDVVWHENGGGEFRKGVLAHGYFAEPQPEEPPSPVDAWPPGTRVDTTRFTDAADKTYAVILWTILPTEWPRPDHWCQTLHLTLQAFTAAIAGWCAVEGSLGDRFVCTAELDERYTPLSRKQMIEFRDEMNLRLDKRAG